MEELEQWQVYGDEVSRMKVEGGYIYRTIYPSSKSMAMGFVPDIDLARYQSHLRDAYNKGYVDGQEDAKHGVDKDQEGPV